MERFVQKAREITVNKQGMELLSHGTSAFPVAIYDVDFTIDSFLWHWHDELEFGVVAAGEIDIYIGTNTYRLKAGEAYFANAGILHAGYNVSLQTCRLKMIVFHPSIVGGASGSVFWQDYVKPVIEDRSLQGLYLSPAESSQRLAVEAILAAWQSCADRSPGYPFQVRNILSEILFQISKNQEQPHTNLDMKYLRSNQRVQQMLGYISKHYADSITLREIADSAAVSPSECLRCFHNIIHITPIQYLRDYRINQAAERLKTSSACVSEIARQCGFLEMSYFSKVFRKKYGCSPVEFRREHLK